MTSRHVHAVLGREREVAAVTAFIELIPDGPRALVLEGEAGIGKTTLWLEAVHAAEDRGYRVLQARPAESEAKLSYTALADIVGAAFDETRVTLPAPQERALAAALLRDATDEPPEARTIATAVIGVLTALATEQPVLVAIDDVQWLDPASEGALQFAVRRLPPQLGLLATRRTEGGGDLPLGLERALPEHRLECVVPGPLSLAALHHLIVSRLGKALPRPTLGRIAEASGGNPFFALEIARALARAPDERAPDDPLPVPRVLKKLVADRLGTLSAGAQEVVLAAAALSRPRVPTVVEALSSEADAMRALLEAENAGVLATEHDRVRFTHPLLASAVYGSASDARRRQLHARLADVVTDPEERARHRAHSVLQADEATAAEIEQGARRAALRGANEAAAELFEASCRVTPAGLREALVRRTLGQATALLKTGNVADARLLATGTVADGLPRALQAERFELLADVEWDAGATRLATEYLERAVAAASEDGNLSARILTRLVLVGMPANPARALGHAERVMPLLSEEREPELLGSVLIDRFLGGVFLGRGARRELLQRGLELEARAGPALCPHPVPLLWLQCVDEVEAARERHALEDRWARDHGDERLRASRLCYLALVELHAGRWELAEQHAERSCEAIGELDVGGRFAYVFAWRSLIDAHRGRIERARATLRPVVEEAARTEKAWWGANLLSVLGFVEFAAGDYEAADGALRRMRDLFDGIGIKDGVFDRTEPFHVEALIGLGELNRARETLERLEERGRTIPRLWIDATLPRTRALVLAAEGDPTAALESVEELDVTAAARLPFDLGWALLVKGRLYRRLKQRRTAAESLREALTIFEQLGAPTWAKQAHSELARVGPRRRAPDELTATELRVAELSAGGMTNREVAKAAFMSAKTVEANLTRVYRKLGIRSRAELGARLAEQVKGSEGKT
jgi:DNA-binding CsgD family transcriptional regulator